MDLQELLTVIVEEHPKWRKEIRFTLGCDGNPEHGCPSEKLEILSIYRGEDGELCIDLTLMKGK